VNQQANRSPDNNKQYDVETYVSRELSPAELEACSAIIVDGGAVDACFTYLSVQSGLAKNTIFEVENGRTEPRLNTIAALAGSFGKSLSKLLRGL
jgi:transcriptional regulator with XRE-family HTH domain